MLKDELLDLVDNQDNIIGQIARSKVWQDHIKNVRVINVFLINSKNELWIPKRTSRKKIFPSCLDFSVGGYVMTSESYEQAFKREVSEELNLDTSKLNHCLLFHLSPYEHNVSSFMHVYQIKTDTVPNYNIHDFDSYSWLTIDELKATIKNGIAAKNDLLTVLLYLESCGNP